MTTKEAFDELTSIRGWYKLCGINPSTARSLKHHAKNGMMREQQQRELLLAAGYKLTPERWETNKK